MTQKKSELRRIMLAITESSSLSDLWAAVENHLTSEPAELITLYLSDDRWHRAASLPFTREITRFGGRRAEFTPQRADQVGQDAMQRAYAQLRQLATDASIELAFEMLQENELTRLQEFVTSESDVLIAPAFFKGQPVYAELTRLKCRLLLIDSPEVTSDEESS